MQIYEIDITLKNPHQNKYFDENNYYKSNLRCFLLNYFQFEGGKILIRQQT